MNGMKRAVNLSVTAQIGPVYLRLFPYSGQPWAWGALCRVTFWFGDLRVTKRLSERYVYRGPAFNPASRRPSEASIARGREAVLGNLVVVIRRHGVDVALDDLTIKEPGELEAAT